MKAWTKALINAGLVFVIVELGVILTYCQLPDVQTLQVGLITGAIAFLVQLKGIVDEIKTNGNGPCIIPLMLI